ncbi:TetR family transcriptional regulator [Antricoccus suffuscus]|uniref:TetR family transcriptional regulator n=1 Tax=Antricoccus suffuscus TaxID=1629062 RepID=A0A2T1A693_9ACTN|nr:TetR/AcrR family transcriptional regulator [Antricoccus suffuscus]PRZ43997.1 TetR family transcriptional regulator [Antricoccus suffuscus]
MYEAAVELFIARGYDNITMDEIAERADVARATVFNHFQRKVEFLHEWSARRRQRAQDAIRRENLQSHSTRDILARYMHELAILNEETRRETVALMTATIHATNILDSPYLVQEIAGYVRRGQNAGETRKGIDAEQVGVLLATGYFATLNHWIKVDPHEFPLGPALEEMLKVVLHGIEEPRPQTARHHDDA